jgi:hypothetical protein
MVWHFNASYAKCFSGHGSDLRSGEQAVFGSRMTLSYAVSREIVLWLTS